ncbi:MAG: protein kinase domain-containing protein [Flavisolibacter sp.]
MGKLFTITEGLENLGAIKTGGQGSVYKGKRIGEIITAVKLLPTPIENEDPSNKHYIDFKNEVEKLKKVNEEPNPNVVKIVGSGITDTGCFPFIEMEFIEGPDLGELLKPPHETVFTIKETVRVVEQLANALAHCHKVGVRHGDIKSNNVKLNVHTGNYVLLDFGLAIMSDEERRTSLRHAGAIEFMAPEQNEGQMLFQSDVYSFGIIIYELLAGEVPFPLQDNGETSRNHVRLAHMEIPVPDLLPLRKKNLPAEWTEQKKIQETQLPTWLSSMIERCLEKDPAKRFSDGKELQEYILLNSALEIKKEELNIEGSEIWWEENQKLLVQKDLLQQQLMEHQKDLASREKELQELRTRLQRKEELIGVKHGVSNKKIVSGTAFYGMIFLTVILASLAVYGLFFHNNTSLAQGTTGIDSQMLYNDSVKNISTQENAAKKPVRQKTKAQQKPDSARTEEEQIENGSVQPLTKDSAINEQQKKDTISQEY